MTVRKKTLLIISLTTACLLITLFITSEVFIIKGFLNIEQETIQRNVGRARDALFDDILELDRFAANWAGWDDTYVFVKDANSEYIKVNLVDETFKGAKLNLVLFVNVSGQIVFSKCFDLTKEKEVPLPADINEHISVNRVLLRHSDTDSRVNGIILLSDGPMLIVSRPIITSKKQGPIRGSLIMGRYLGASEIKYLGKISHLSINIHPYNDAQMPSDFQLAAASLSDKKPIFIQTLSKDSIAGYYLLQDIYKKPALILRVDTYRAIYNQGLISITYFLYYILGMGGIVNVVALLLFNKAVLSRLVYLSAGIKKIGEGSDVLMRLQIKGKDELTILADEINRMLESLEGSQAALKESEIKYRSLYDSIKDGVARVDMQGYIVECNQAYLDMLGYTEEEIKKLTYRQLTPDRWHKMEEDIVQHQIIERGYSDVYEKEYIKKDGTVFPIVIRAWLLKDNQARPIGIWAIIRDISERKHKEKELVNAYEQLKTTQMQLVQSAKMASIGQLASGLAHEINNPLTGVLNNLQMLKMEIEKGKDFNPQDIKEVLAIIEESALRCKKVTQTLLDFSHVSKGQFKLVFLNEAIEKIMLLIEQEISSENIIIQKRLQPDLPRIFGDVQLLQQSLLDIIANSRWAIRQKSKEELGLITIKTHYEPEKNMVLLSISDNGIGIPKENLDKIFEPFFTTKPVGEGTGLGLAIVYSIIKQHRGIIEMESQLNYGTTFKIYLPILNE